MGLEEAIDYALEGRRILAEARAELGDGTVETAWSTGQAMAAMAAIDNALRGRGPALQREA